MNAYRGKRARGQKNRKGMPWDSTEGHGFNGLMQAIRQSPNVPKSST